MDFTGVTGNPVLGSFFSLTETFNFPSLCNLTGQSPVDYADSVVTALFGGSANPDGSVNPFTTETITIDGDTITFSNIQNGSLDALITLANGTTVQVDYLPIVQGVLGGNGRRLLEISEDDFESLLPELADPLQMKSYHSRRLLATPSPCTVCSICCLAAHSWLPAICHLPSDVKVVVTLYRVGVSTACCLLRESEAWNC